MNEDKNPAFSLNNRVLVEAYKEDRGLKAKVNNGFAMVEQKVTLKGLKAVVDAHITLGMNSLLINKGDLVFIKESTLTTAAWSKSFLSAEGVEGDFMIVDVNQIEFVVPQ